MLAKSLGGSVLTRLWSWTRRPRPRLCPAQGPIFPGGFQPFKTVPTLVTRSPHLVVELLQLVKSGVVVIVWIGLFFAQSFQECLAVAEMWDMVHHGARVESTHLTVSRAVPSLAQF